MVQCRGKEGNSTDSELLSDNKTVIRCSNGQRPVLLGIVSKAQLTCLAMAAGHHHLPVDLTRPTEAAQTAGDRTVHHISKSRGFPFCEESPKLRRSDT